MCTVCHTGLVSVGWGQLPCVHRGEVVPDTTAWGCVCSEVNVVAFLALACTRWGPRFKGMSDEPGRACTENPAGTGVYRHRCSAAVCTVNEAFSLLWGDAVCLVEIEKSVTWALPCCCCLSPGCVRVSIDSLWPWALHLRPAIKSYFHTPPPAS